VLGSSSGDRLSAVGKHVSGNVDSVGCGQVFAVEVDAVCCRLPVLLRPQAARLVRG